MKLLSWLLKFTVLCTIAIVGGYYAAEALVKEDMARVAKLEQHFYELALNRAPAPPQGLRLQPEALAVPKTTVFKDVSESTGMGYDKRKAERRGK